MVEDGEGPRGVQEGYILDRGENGGYRIMGRNPLWVKSGQFDDLPWFFFGGFHHIPPPPLSFLWWRSRRKYARVGHLLKLLWNSSIRMWKMIVFQKNDSPKTRFPEIRFSKFWCQKTPQKHIFHLDLSNVPLTFLLLGFLLIAGHLSWRKKSHCCWCSLCWLYLLSFY